MNFLRFLIILTSFLSSAYGTTVTSNFTVQATVAGSCQVAATTLNFGSYNMFASSTGNSTLTVTCTTSTGYTVALNAGLGTGATVAIRKMTSSGNTLPYALYTDNGLTTLWGDGTASTTTVAGTGNGAAQNITIYGNVPAGSTAPAGSYSDTVQITVTF